MLRFLKRLFILACIVVVAIVAWGAFAIWTGIYSVYSSPPGRGRLEGETLIVTREAGEPMFNSPDYKPAPQKAAPKATGLGFGTVKKPAQPLQLRIIVKLPYVEWAYRKSLEPESPPADE